MILHLLVITPEASTAVLRLGSSAGPWPALPERRPWARATKWGFKLRAALADDAEKPCDPIRFCKPLILEAMEFRD